MFVSGCRIDFPADVKIGAVLDFGNEGAILTLFQYLVDLSSSWLLWSMFGGYCYRILGLRCFFLDCERYNTVLGDFKFMEPF